jgi:hypothetical protein
MSNQLPHDPGADPLEADLPAYAPRPPRIDRDRLMFEAGRAAAHSELASGASAVLRQGVLAWFPVPPGLGPTNWVWPAATVTMTLVAATFGIALLLRSVSDNQPPVARHGVRSPSMAAPAAPHPPLAVSTGGLPQSRERRPSQPEAHEEPVLSVDSLPENHLLRVRQVALTEGVESLAPPVSRETSRLSPPPTRGALMRTMMMTRGAPTSPSTFWQWSKWITP